jgi:hypothetical protein
MATLTVVTPNSGGALATPAAVSASDKFANSGRCLLLVTNGSGAPINVTIDSQLVVDGNAVPDKVIAVAAGATRAIGPLDPSIYNDGNGDVSVAFSAQASVTATVLQVA